jgi:hypothetical protein
VLKSLSVCFSRENTVTPVRLLPDRLSSIVGVSISIREQCTLSKTGSLANLRVWLPKLIAEKGFEIRKVYPLARSSLVSILLPMLIWPYKPVHPLSVHFS